MFFQHSNDQIIISDDAATLTMIAAEFATLEPEYELFSGMITRVWRDDGGVCYRSDGRSQYPDVFTGAAYCAKLSTYQRRLAALRYTAPTPDLLDPTYHQLLEE